MGCGTAKKKRTWASFILGYLEKVIGTKSFFPDKYFSRPRSLWEATSSLWRHHESYVITVSEWTRQSLFFFFIFISIFASTAMSRLQSLNKKGPLIELTTATSFPHHLSLIHKRDYGDMLLWRDDVWDSLWEQLVQELLTPSLLLQVISGPLLDEGLQVVGVLLHAGQEVVQYVPALVFSTHESGDRRDNKHR